MKQIQLEKQAVIRACTEVFCAWFCSAYEVHLQEWNKPLLGYVAVVASAIHYTPEQLTPELFLICLFPKHW